MASKVFANKKAVATTKTGHIAHSVGPDVRLVNNKEPTELPNFIESEHLARNLPQLTELDSAKIWVFPSECGDPPPSKPADGWPGESNGGIVNGMAAAAPGTGSPNVFVEGDKVIRFGDDTKQNAGNSDGIIDDQAGFDEYMKSFAPKAPPLPPTGPGSAQVTGDATGAPTEGDQRQEDPQTIENKPPEQTSITCALTGVKMHEGPRNQSGAVGDPRGPVIELVGGTNVSFEAEGSCCGEHPRWTNGRSSQQGMAVTYEGPAYPSLRLTPGFVAFWTLGDADPRTMTVVADGCQGHFEREVRVFPAGEHRSEITFFEDWAKVFIAVGNFFARLNILILNEDTKVAVGAIRINARWREDPSWQAYCESRIEGRLTIIEWKKDFRFEFERWLIPIPAVKALQVTYALVNDLWEFATKKPLAELYVFIRPEIAAITAIALVRTKYYNAAPRWSGEWTATGFGRVSVGLAVDVRGGLFRAEGNINTSGDITGTVFFAPDPGLRVMATWNPLQGAFILSWDLTDVVTENASRIPIIGGVVTWGMTKADVKLKGTERREISFFDAMNVHLIDLKFPT